MKPNTYQQAILDFLLTEKENIYVDAVAGSGKTTTLQFIAEILSPFENSLFVAFNRHIKDTLDERLPNSVEIKTIHGLGYSMLSKNFCCKIKLDDHKYANIARRFASELKIDSSKVGIFVKEVATIVSYVRTLMVVPTRDAIGDICRKFNIDLLYKKEVCTIVPRVLLTGITEAKDVIDFTDMIFIPLICNMGLYKKYSTILIDEAQDISPLQLRFIKSLCNKDTRCIFVGDRYQSIYGFAGVDSNSIDIMIKKFDAKLFSLPICYRCPVKHIKAANKYTKREILPHANSNQGILEVIAEYELFEKAKAGDLVLCRMTTPLIRLCIDLNARGIKSFVRNGNLAEDLLYILYKVEDYTNALNLREENISYILDRFFEYYVSKFKPNMQNAKEWAIRLEDKLSSIEAIAEYYKITDITELAGNIKEFLREPADSRVCLSTIHKAKGLEADRVFIIRPDLIPSPLAVSVEEKQQERNLAYVALTRAKKELYICS